MTAATRALRLVPIVLLALALWNPGVPWSRTPLDLVLAVDDSASVDRDALGAAWRRLAGLSDSVRAGGESGQVRVIRFGADAALETPPLALSGPGGEESGEDVLAATEPPRRLPLDPNATNIARALELARAQVRPGRPTAVVLLSDGRETTGDAVEALRALGSVGVPVVAIPVARHAVDPDGWIASLTAPPEVRVGEAVRLVAHVGGSRRAPARLEVRLDGALAATRAVGLEPGDPIPVVLGVPIGSSGSHRFEARLALEGDRRPENDLGAAFVHAAGPPRIELVSRHAAGSGLRVDRVDRSPGTAGALRAWSAGDFDRWTRRGEETELVVLDDLEIGSLSEAAWERLARMVERDGTGLLVLGGPRSFGSGGYRHSRLEGLLPATAEARNPREPVAVLFLVDDSGSMARESDGRRRIALARQAIAETLQALADDDLVGVSTFAVEPRARLAFGAHARDPERVKAAVPEPSGGTRLVPALRHGVDRLAEARTDDRILVLVTDGFADDLERGEPLLEVRGALAAAHVQLVVLAVGADVKLAALRALVEDASEGESASEEVARESGSRLLRVDRFADLPRRMREEVEKRLDPIRAGPLAPRVAMPLPFTLPAGAGDWPPLRAAAVTRPRSGARVHLEAADGTPILVAHGAGAGRVAILPAGLGDWAAAWASWPGLPAFSAGLVGWLARPADDTHLRLALDDRPGGIAFEIEALADDGEWTPAQKALVRVVDPAGVTRALDVDATAPGLYRGVLPAPLPGVHRVSATVDGRTVVRRALRTSSREFARADPETEPLAVWEGDALVERWLPDDEGPPDSLAARPRTWAPRWWLAGLALAAYLAVLGYERRDRIQSPRT